MTQDELARYQQAFARIGEAINQCPGCGVFRLDGLPPVLHREDCQDQPEIEDLMISVFAFENQRRLRRLYGLDLT